MCNCDTLYVSSREYEKLLFFFPFLICVYVCFSSKLGWTDTFGVGTGNIIAECIKKHMVESRSYSTCSPHQVWTFAKVVAVAFVDFKSSQLIYHKPVALPYFLFFSSGTSLHPVNASVTVLLSF